PPPPLFPYTTLFRSRLPATRPAPPRRRRHLPPRRQRGAVPGRSGQRRPHPRRAAGLPEDLLLTDPENRWTASLRWPAWPSWTWRSEEHTSELQSREN